MIEPIEAMTDNGGVDRAGDGLVRALGELPAGLCAPRVLRQEHRGVLVISSGE